MEIEASSATGGAGGDGLTIAGPILTHMANSRRSARLSAENYMPWLGD